MAGNEPIKPGEAEEKDLEHQAQPEKFGPPVPEIPEKPVSGEPIHTEPTPPVRVETRAQVQAVYTPEKTGAPESAEKIDLREKPIVRLMLPHTGRLDGDDSGYRDVPTYHEDAENPDDLVDVEKYGINAYPVYAKGARAGITPYYGNGIGSYEKILLREPVAKALKVAEDRLAPYDRQLIVLDGMRTVQIQARLWADIRDRILGAHHNDKLSVFNEIRIGRMADKIGSFSRIKHDEKYHAAMENLQKSQLWSEILDTAQKVSSSPEEIAEEYLIFMTNRGEMQLTLDETSPTSHGGGGAADLWLLDKKSGKPTNLGVPFDYVGRAAVIDFFEWATLEEYRSEVESSQDLKKYLQECGITKVDRAVFEQIRAERRMLTNAMLSVGATFYSLGEQEGEPWHFNVGNEIGGKQSVVLPGAGSSCHSILKNIRDPKTGEITAAWGNEAAHKLARKIMGS